MNEILQKFINRVSKKGIHLMRKEGLLKLSGLQLLIFAIRY